MRSQNRIQRKPKAHYRHGDLKNQLVLASLKLIEQRRGVDFTLRELATATGVTHAAVYKHFPAKHDILLHIASKGFDELNHRFQNLVQQQPLDLASLGVCYLEFAFEFPQHFRVMFHPDLKKPQGKELVPLGYQTYQILKTCVEANLQKKTFQANSADLLSMASWSLVHGLAVLWVNGNLATLPDKSAFPGKKIARPLVEVLLEGLHARK